MAADSINRKLLQAEDVGHIIKLSQGVRLGICQSVRLVRAATSGLLSGATVDSREAERSLHF